MDITFTNVSNFIDIEKPQPASSMIPEWYKTLDSYLGGVKTIKPDGSGTTATIKRCMPVFDAITAGYIITLPADVWVTYNNGNQYFTWSDLGLVQRHLVEQAPNHPNRKPHDYPKWINQWAIKTPKGYSTLFVQPFHRESVFTILPGVVDTDIYTAAVHFPFVINDPEFEGLIPKGTPIAQVIPFKRESWTMKFGGNKELSEQANVMKHLTTKFFNRYKSMFWQKKTFN